MVDFKTHTFGVKFLEKKIVAIEEADLFLDISRYDIILKDMITDSHNRNTSYACDIDVVDANKEYYEINGWKLKRLVFPGNWSGQCGTLILIDKMGKDVEIPGCERSSYFLYNTTMISTCLKAYLKFATSTDCFVHSLGEINFSIGSVNSVKEVKENIASIDEYIQRYENMSKQIDGDQTLTDEEKEKTKSQLTNYVIEQINKCLGK